MKKFAFIITVLLLGTISTVPVFASQPRDCDGNAIIYCGAYSTKELQNKINEKRHLMDFFGVIGIDHDQFSGFKEGLIKKDGTVWVGSDIVASNVYTSGRHKTTNSIREKRVASEIYWRHPSDSFASSSIPAFVYLNYDGSFGYGIIKSCGNPITNSSLKANIKTKPVVLDPKTFDITVNKFEDINANRRRESGERMLRGWTFTLRGNGKNITARTNGRGQVVFTDIPNGTYILTETLNSNWRNTTQNNLRIAVDNKDVIIWFGNRRRQNMDPITAPPTPTPAIQPIDAQTALEPPTAVKAASLNVTELPKTGARENILSLIVIFTGYALFYYLKSKKVLKEKLIKK